MKTWEKFLNYDWDPELFSAFLLTFPLDFKILVDNIKLAVNHDPNIETIVEQGLALLDDLEDADRTKKEPKRAQRDDTADASSDDDKRIDSGSKQSRHKRPQHIDLRTDFLTQGPGALRGAAARPKTISRQTSMNIYNVNP